MNNLANVLKFIELRKMSTRQFENAVGLSNGTISKVGEGGDLSADNISKIVDKFSTELKQAGYYIINLTPFDKKGHLILSEEQRKEFLKQLPTIDHKDAGQSSQFLAGKLSVKDEVIAEKEARRADMEKYYEDAKAEKKELFKALSETRETINGILREVVSNLGDIKEDTYLGLSYQRAWVEFVAEKEANGNKKKKDETVLHMNKLLKSQISANQKVDKKT